MIGAEYYLKLFGGKTCRVSINAGHMQSEHTLDLVTAWTFELCNEIVSLQIVSMSWASLPAGRSQSRTMQEEQATQNQGCWLEEVVTNHGQVCDVPAVFTSCLKYSQNVK